MNAYIPNACMMLLVISQMLLISSRGFYPDEQTKDEQTKKPYNHTEYMIWLEECETEFVSCRANITKLNFP